MSTHPGVPELVALARGRVSAAEATRVRTHCLVCDDCRAMLDTVARLRGLLGAPVYEVPMPACGPTIQ